MKLLSTSREIKNFLGIEPVQSASLRVTQKCNLRCKHCYAAAGQKLKNELTLDEIKRVIDELRELGAIRIFFTGGEPFTREDFVEVLSYAQRNKFAIYLSTNGALINRGLISRLRNLDLRVFQVSVDGLEKTHDSIRGVSGSFSKAINAIKLAKRNLKNTEIALASTLMRENVHEIDKLLDLAIQIKVNIFALIPLFPAGRSLQIDDLTLQEKREIFSKVCQLYKMKKANLNLPTFPYLSILISPGVIPESLPKTKYGCGFVCTFPSILGINANGDVFPCDGLIGYKKLLLGNIRKNSLKEIWNHPLMKKSRKMNPNDLDGVCKKCRYLSFCMGGCRAHAFIKYGNFKAPDPLCQSFYENNLFPKKNLI